MKTSGLLILLFVSSALGGTLGRLGVALGEINSSRTANSH